MHSIAPNSLSAWILASRPKTLGAILSPVLVGSALAYTYKKFDFSIMFISIICAILLQILANIVNDYCDFIKGKDTAERLGPPRAMQLNLITPEVMQKGIGLLLLAIIFSGMPLIFRAGLEILALGILCIFFSVWYTAGPKPLSYLGFSEIAVLIFFGPVPLLGAYYCQTLSYSLVGLAASVGPAFLATALIMTNNLRDIQEDAKNNKKTIAVRFGEEFSRRTIIFLIITSMISPVMLVVFFGYNYLLLIILILLAIPARSFKAILHDPVSRDFNIIFAHIGQMIYLYGILFSIGIICASP